MVRLAGERLEAHHGLVRCFGGGKLVEVGVHDADELNLETLEVAGKDRSSNVLRIKRQIWSEGRWMIVIPILIRGGLEVREMRLLQESIRSGKQ